MKHMVTGTLLAGAVIGFSATAAVAGAPGARPGDNSVVPYVRTVPTGHQGTRHPPRCGLAGTWDNTYGATITMSTARKGTYVASYCGSPWKVKRTARSRTGFSVHMTYTGTDGCRGFTENMTWNGCSTASGNYIDDSGGTTGPDTWTKADPRRVK
jgi:hypothetical protein